MRAISVFVLALSLLGTDLVAQESGPSLLAAGRKRLQDATGKRGPERDEILADAVRILKMVPERFPADVSSCTRAWLEAGRVERRLGQAQESEASLRKVLEHPEQERPCCDALHELATLYRKQKRMEDAKAVLQQVIDQFASQPAERAQALIRLAGLQRDTRDLGKAEETLLRVLSEHGDLWRSAVDALDDLVALKLRQKDAAAARKLLDAHTQSLQTRFAGTPLEERVERALDKMASRARLDGGKEPKPVNGEPAGGNGNGNGNVPD